MWSAYIIKSIRFDKYYTGHTENLERRIKEHNLGKTRLIKHYIPFQLIYSEQYNSKQEAYKRERQIKKYKGGEAFKKLIARTDQSDLEACQSGRMGRS